MEKARQEQDYQEDTVVDTRPRRTIKPSQKVIENRIVEDKAKLENIWQATLKKAEVSKLRENKHSFEYIESIRKCFLEYQTICHTLVEFIGSTDSFKGDLEEIEETWLNRKHYVEEIVLECQAFDQQVSQVEAQSHSGGSCTSSVSVASLRAAAKAKAAAALKKAELQNARSQIEDKESTSLAQEELELARRRRLQRAKLENLKLQDEAAVALEEAKILDQELGFDEGERYPPVQGLPSLSTFERTQQYVSSLSANTIPTSTRPAPDLTVTDVGHPILPLETNFPSSAAPILNPRPRPAERSVSIEPRVPQFIQSPGLPRIGEPYQLITSPVNASPVSAPPPFEGAPGPQEVHASLPHFPMPVRNSPSHIHPLSTPPHRYNAPYSVPQLSHGVPLVSGSPQMNDTRSQSLPPYLQFMARQELIGKKVEQFDDRPENFRTWKTSFMNLIRNVPMTPSEQLSLIIEHTSNESRKLVQRLRNAYVENPERGVQVVWEKLAERFGSDAVVTHVQLTKLHDFPKIGTRDSKKLQELGDLLLELQCAKENIPQSGLQVLDEPTYLRPVLAKLPEDVLGRWQRYAYRFKTQHRVNYPPFREFSEFIQEVAREKNDPYLMADIPNKQVQPPRASWKINDGPDRRQGVTVAKTELSESDQPVNESDPSKWCLVHKKPHPLRKCREFRSKSLRERKEILAENKVCFRCVSSNKHFARDCEAELRCSECQSDKHVSALHPSEETTSSATGSQDGEERESTPRINDPAITANCTKICGEPGLLKSCSKICLAHVYHSDRPDKKIKAYIIIDDQSNFSLAKSKLFDILDLQGQNTSFTLKTCSGVEETNGRRAQNIVVESLDGHTRYQLPTVTECDNIPDSKEEIPTPEVAEAHRHLMPIAQEIPELDNDAEVLLLIGRDAPSLHKVRESRNGPKDAPWAQRLDLGWVVLGNVCLEGTHRPSITTCKTQILHNGRPSLLEPCPKKLYVKESVSAGSQGKPEDQTHRYELREFGENVFATSECDDEIGYSVEDRQFLQIMQEEMKKNDLGNWEVPLPFRHEVRELPNSRDNALRRLKSTCRTLEKKPVMKAHYHAFMKQLFDNGHAEPVPPNTSPNTPSWYLPHFGVYHPQKPDKIRVVFDSAASSGGVSLNDLLLSGPDLTNNLLGVLLRFRQGPIGVVADIQQMFHSFHVQENHRDFLRFLWFNSNGEVAEYRMKVHLFGNTSSPAVATCGLRKTAEVEAKNFGTDAVQFVEKNFYVDDGLASKEDLDSAVDLLKRTQAMLATANIRLHKIASNKPEVLQAFPVEDRATDLSEIDLSQGDAPIQRSLGVSWNLAQDTFVFRVKPNDRPFTRRGVLSITNSLYDPFGLVAPVVIRAKALLRTMMADPKENKLETWDDPISEDYRPVWEAWCNSLRELESLQLSRPYATIPLKLARTRELHTFCDASVEAIGAVSYLRVILPDGEVQVAFVLGKAKLSPLRATTIPRLDLCAAVLGVELTEVIVQSLDDPLDSITYYSDSRVVLGYISNTKRRFYVYVANRVERIRRSSRPEQWKYVSTDVNPADLASRAVEASDLADSTWLTGPKFLYSKEPASEADGEDQGTWLEEDPEVRPAVTVLVTKEQPIRQALSKRFEKFSTWGSLVRAISNLIRIARLHSKRPDPDSQLMEFSRAAILKAAQEDTYGEDIIHLRKGKKLRKTSPLFKLNAFVDSDGLVRVGGRLRRGDLTLEECHPIVIPGKHHVATLLVRHLHARAQHQGRTFTQGIIRSSGYWIVGGSRLVNRVINQCVKCRKLRARNQQQKMADLPVDRLTVAPPFSYVGLDVFGPWKVTARRTRGGLAESKRWAVIFTCLAVRAVHIEVIESMDASNFINALRRFLAIRGPAKRLRSDCGSNFVGARNELQVSLKPEDVNSVRTFLFNEGCEWVFNPPHASHMGGSWERMIGVARKILNSMLHDLAPGNLTHEVLTTLMAEVSAIINARPLVPISTDPEAPEVLTPASLLTQKSTSLTAPPGDFNSKDLLRSQWRRVQHLADNFWSRWRKEYLAAIQLRRKWQCDCPDLEVGNVVLLRSKDTGRNSWPLARITKTYKSPDGKVRSVEVATAVNGQRRNYDRPVSEVVLLMVNDDKQQKSD